MKKSGEENKNRKAKKKSSLDGVTCPEFHWGLTNVRRKPEKPEVRQLGADILARTTGRGGGDGDKFLLEDKGDGANLVCGKYGNRGSISKMNNLQA